MVYEAEYSMESDSGFRTLDDFCDVIASKDTNVRLEVFNQLESYLTKHNPNLHCADLNSFCNSILAWITSSNFKISMNGLVIIQLIVQRLPDKLQNYTIDIVTHVVDRLSDPKDQVRSASKNILVFMMATYTPIFIWDRLNVGFNHKLPKIREEILDLLWESFDKFGASNMNVPKMVTFIVKLLTDQNQFVREKALNCLVEVYKTVGDRLRNELKKKQLPEEKLKLIFSKFDEILKSGKFKDEVKNTSILSSTQSTTKTNDFADLSTISSVSITSGTSQVKTMQRPPSKIAISKAVPPRGSSVSSGGAGAVDEGIFVSEFEKTPPINIYGAREIEQHITQICESFNNGEDWAGRMNALKRIRGLVIAARDQYETEVLEAIRKTSAHFANQVKDLRSQIVREACITLAFLAQQFSNRLETFMELQMPNLINLLQNSAKIMATSGLIAIRFIIENVHSTKLIPFITSGLESRSKEIRRACCDYLSQILQAWETNYFERSVQALANAIKKGLVDADQEARNFSRKAFWAFQSHFPTQADTLYQSLEKKVKNLLSNGAQGTNGSVKSLNNGHGGDQVDSRPSSISNATPGSKIKRSTSAVDIKNARSNSSLGKCYETRVINKIMDTSIDASDILAASELENTDLLQSDEFSFDLESKSSLFSTSLKKLRPGSRIPMPNENAQRIPVVSRIPTSSLATPSKASRIVQSQPGSRSTSPTPKYSYITNNLNTSVNGHMSPLLNNSLLNNLSELASTPPPTNYSHIKSKINTGLSQSGGSTKSRLPTSSRNSSRESSPGRRSNYGSERRASLSKTPSRRINRTLSNSQEGESVIAQSITSKYYMKNRVRRGWDDMSDEASETSSLCSERSFTSSIGGNRVTEDINDSITLLHSQTWTDKRDGLANIKLMMQSNRLFTRQEVKRLTELLGKMFNEVNVKVFSTFLDTLEMFIRVNKVELREWLPILLPKLLSRLGSENSQTLYSKLCTCLEAIRVSFDTDYQFRVLIKFLRDPATDKNLKSRVAVLKYLQDIICLIEPVDFQVTDDLKHAITKIILFTAEPKSQDIRRASQAVLIGLFNLNTPEFSALINELPVNVQQTVTEVLKTHMRSLGSESSRVKKSPNTYSSLSKFKPQSQYFSDYLNENSAQLSHVIKDIQNLNMGSNFYKPKKLDTLSKDSGVQSNADADSDSDGATSSVSSTSKLPSINQILAILDPVQGVISPSTNEKLKAMKDLTELIKAGNRPESKWEDNFKNVLLFLFQYIDRISTSNENTIDQALDIQTLLCLRELLQFHYKEFKDYIELTIIKLLGNYRETPQNELYKLVEDVIYTAGRCLPAEPTARILKPIIEQAEYPRNLMAIRMLQKAVEQMSAEMGNRLLHDILSALLTAWDSPHSPVRKAAVFCLVSLYMTIGDPLRDHLTHLSSSKIKLLNVYINRAKESREQVVN